MNKTAICIGFAIIIVIGVIAYGTFRPIDYVAEGKDTVTFDLNCEYDKFRQIMVRKNATAAIVNHGGLTIVNEGVQDLSIDISKDERPILNALRGHSKTDVTATKTLTVRLNDAQIKQQDLTLRQQAEIDEKQFKVETASIGEQGSVEAYNTTLNAQPSGTKTRIILTLVMKIKLKIPKLFTSQADTRVQKSTESALVEQRSAITEFIIKHINERIILPVIGD